MARIPLNKQDSFLADCVYKSPEGVPTSLTGSGITISAYAEPDGGGVVIPISVTLSNQVSSPGGFKLRSEIPAWLAKVNTRTWNVFIRYTRSDGASFSSRLEVDIG